MATTLKGILLMGTNEQNVIPPFAKEPAFFSKLSLCKKL